jgi:cell volume regulation protein A
MDEYSHFFLQLVAVTGLLLAGLVLSPLAARLRLPGPAAFLAVGIAAGLAGVEPSDQLSTLQLEQVGAIALYAVLFQGGLATGFAAWRASARPIVLLGLPGTAATAAGLAVIAHYVLGLEWALAAFVGIALAPTDPAAVYAVLRGQGSAGRPRTILEGESGFNDPIGISLMIVAVELVTSDEGSVATGAVHLVEELGIGLAGGLAGAAALIIGLRATPRLEEGLQATAIVLGAMLFGAGTATLGGSGFLAVYVAGLLLADSWAKQDGRHHRIPEALSGISEPVLFGLLGATFAPLVVGGDVWRGVVLTLATAFLVRPLVAAACLHGSRLARLERVLVSWGGLKGAVPLLLAAFPALEGYELSDRSAGIVLVATAASIVVQGGTLHLVARRAAAGRPPRMHST